MLILLAVALLAAGVALLLLSRRARAETGLPEGRVIVSDTSDWKRIDAPLISRRHGLVGKPDYIVEQGGRITPVEVKPNRRAETPYLSDVLQLAAYCLLIEEAWGKSPAEGLLRYADRTFAVEWTSELRDVLIETLDAMRSDMRAANVNRDHNEAGRCAACGVREHCDQRLA
ncbi:MAG: Dna2/Cas4 domain-containing protein [Anaerolineae bacterium]